MKKSIFLCATLLIFISGCSIKETDTPEKRFAKHTVNTPVYIVLGAGYVAKEGSEFLIKVALFPPFYIYKLTKDKNSTDINSSKNTQILHK